ncbi:MAG: T9SS type A sorting domain-containing protein [Candidatus Kapaibacterium sp.]
MNKLLAFLVMLSFVSVTAQDDLTEKNFPKIGVNGNYRSSTPQPLMKLDGLGGQDMVWDYSTITNTQDLEQVFWKPVVFASKEAQATFPNATYFQTSSSITSVTNFVSVDNESHKLLGYKVTTDYLKFDKPLDYYPYPMKFGQKYESTFAYDYEGKASGVYTVIYDGYGTLQLPDKTFENVFRLKLNYSTVFEEEPNDTIKSVEFQFINRENGRLLFTVVELAAAENPDQKIYNYQYFVSPIINSVNEELSEKTEVYPNPSSNFIKVDVPNRMVLNYEIIDLNGNTVTSSIYSNKIDITSLAIGTYFVKANLISNDVVLKKFIKQ